MATSGTVGLTTIDATSVIEHAARRCGVLASAIPAEVQLSSRENLFFILSNFAYKGMALWCVQKLVYQLLQGAVQLNLDVGVEEVLNPLLRTNTVYPATALSAGLATYTPAIPVAINSVALTVPAGAYSFVLEGSPDGVTWASLGSRTVTTTASSTVCFDAEPTLVQAYWRVRETVLGVVVPSVAYFNVTRTEVPMTIMSRDTYTSLPNKAAAGAPLQYWYDKAIPQQRMWLWRVAPDSTTYQAVVWNKRTIQDVGDLSNTLDIPQRWQDAIISELATRVYLELPKELVPADRYPILVSRAEQSLSDVLDAEVDGAPTRLVPNISGYTR